MAADEREEEQEFLAELKARSGRDLAGWMAAITQHEFADKNEVIDWLRAQGFPFARASWLERIHSNGGRPIYDEKPERPLKPPLRSKAVQAQQTVLEQPHDVSNAASSASDEALLERLISGAKGYRPLYLMLEAGIRTALPSAVLTPRPGYISLGAPLEFAAITLHPTEVRLGLDLGERPFDAYLQRSKLKGPGGRITHMIVLTDARQINADLMDMLLAANARAQG